MGLNPRNVFHVVFLFLIAVFKSEDKNLKFFKFLSSLCFFGKNASGFESHKAHFNITSIVMCLQNFFF